MPRAKFNRTLALARIIASVVLPHDRAPHCREAGDWPTGKLTLAA